MRKALHWITFMFLSLLVFAQVLGVLIVPANAQGLDVSGNDVVRIENLKQKFYGDIIISGNGTLFVENSTITLVQTSANQYKIVLQNPSNGYPRLIVRNSSFASTKSFGIYLYSNSYMYADRLNFRYSLNLHDVSNVSLFSSTVSYIYAYDNSSFFASGVTSFQSYAYDLAKMKFTSSKITWGYAFDFSNVSLSVSEMTSGGLFTEDSSVLYISSSKIAGDFFAKENSRIEMWNVRMDYGGRFYSYDSSNFTIWDSSLKAGATSNKFSSWDSSIMSFSNVYVRDAQFSSFNNSVLLLDDGNFLNMWLRSEDGSNVNVINSSISWLLNPSGFSHVSVIQSSVIELFAQSSSQVEVSASNVSLLRVYDTSNVSVSDSLIDEVSARFFSVNCTLDDFGVGVSSRNFTTNEVSPSLSVSNAEITKGWDLKFSGSSNVTLTDSVLEFLEVYDFVSVSVLNSTLVGYSVSDNATVSVWSYLTIQAVDYFGNPIAQANVTVSNSNPTLTKLTDNEGLAVFELFDRVVNSTGTYSAGSYEVSVFSGGFSSEVSAELVGSTKYTVTLPLPSWYWYAIAAGVVLAVVLAGIFVYFMFRKRLGRRVVS